MIRVVHPGSRIPDPGVKKAPNPGSGSATLSLTRIHVQCVKGGGNAWGSVPPADKNLRKVPLQVIFFRWRHFNIAFYVSYLSTGLGFSCALCVDGACLSGCAWQCCSSSRTISFRTISRPIWSCFRWISLPISVPDPDLLGLLDPDSCLCVRIRISLSTLKGVERAESLGTHFNKTLMKNFLLKITYNLPPRADLIVINS